MALKRTLGITALFLSTLIGHRMYAQELVNGNRTFEGKVNMASATETAVDKIVSTLPSTCDSTNKERVFVISTVQEYVCTGTNTWSQVLIGSVNASQINATGTANSSTFLRGDGTWATVSSGGTYTLPNSVPIWSKYTVSYSTLSATAGTTQTVNLFTLSSARQKVCGVSTYVVTPFAGTGLTNVSVSVGDSNGTSTFYAPALSLTATASQDNNVLGSASPGSGIVQANFTTTGGNLNALTAGSVDVDVCLVTQP